MRPVRQSAWLSADHTHRPSGGQCGEHLLSRLRFVERTGSTNADLIADRAAAEGEWLIAGQQDGGRGRQGRGWDSPPGNFHGSTIVQLRDADAPPATLSLVAGVALIRAVEVAAPATGLMLKWPNDLLLGPGKLAGVLLERSGERVVAGFGVNLAHAPNLPGRATSALAPIALVSPEAFAPLLAASFARELQRWRDDLPATIGLWRESAHQIGTPLTVHTAPDEKISGTFDGLEPDGRLRLRLETGEVRVIHAADVMLG
ncbi:biotin--[acetyl-CoA-carboxylase] ligase [Sphingomonas sp. KRR8]|uniref:biotin--[acetyl-CoA-carboxylase] ligase n=1 Tax=Sphingomonas sp. KRR8 TaxID=2942996 RepID=UPI00201FE0B8|nr:biotin--[acetyl-CoA-carboxylase] ligase [Sphingomonas sp. KRR8]URD61488.1 biotin--[acetyl-CoA-carboxylase] ligase [Sphingomonas sp. KRR8]